MSDKKTETKALGGAVDGLCRSCFTVQTLWSRWGVCLFVVGGGTLFGGGWEMVRTQSDKSDRILTQIAETRAEPQQIVVQRLLSCLQYPVPYTTRLQEI